jgi:hypothetical protein
LARRVSLPTADDLFRPTTEPDAETGEQEQAEQRPAQVTAQGTPQQRRRPVAAVPEPAKTDGARRSSGRVRHDEKMTVYVTADELVEIEHTRLTLRRDHGLAVDRGRLVREALAIVLADLDEHGDDSVLVRRLIR